VAYLGSRSKTGTLSTRGFFTPGTSLWVIEFQPQELVSDADFEMWHGAVRGPGGNFMVYLDDALYGVAENGSINEYAPPGGAMYVRKGQTITFNWSIATGSAPRAWIYLREPEVGRI
jgi:hypothetical protein